MDTVLLNGFSLEILSSFGPVEKVIYREGNYFSLPDGSEYKLKLGNDHDTRVDAHVWIDGEKVGVWRINPYSSIVIERPHNISRKFTLFKEGTRRAIRAGVKNGDHETGIIKVIFKPENIYYSGIFYNNPTHLNETDHRLYRWECSNDYTDTVTPSDKQNRRCNLNAYNYEVQGRPNFGINLQNSFSSAVSPNYSSAGSVLGDDSLQRFKRTKPLDEIDTDMITTIYARLVVDDDRTTYKRDYIGIKHAMKTNKIPPRINGPTHMGRSHYCYKDSPFILSRKYWFDNLH